MKNNTLFYCLAVILLFVIISMMKGRTEEKKPAKDKSTDKPVDKRTTGILKGV